MKINRSTIFQWLKVILPILLMIFAIHELGKIIKEANGEQIAAELGSIDVRTLVLIAIIPLILTSPMFFYDFFIMKKLKLKIPLKRLAKESLIINTFSNLIGFGGLVGVLLRTHYFKKPEMENGAFFKTIASVTLFYLAGISLFADLILIFFWDMKLFNEHPFLLLVAGFIGLYTPFLIIKACAQLALKKVEMKHVLGDLALVFVSVAEWLGAFSMLVILTKLLNIDVPIIELWPMFVIASAAGIVSMIPGGLGSFDLVFIWGATSLNIPSESILVLLLFYRIGYYVIPFIAGLILFLRDIWRSFNLGYNSIPNVILERTSHLIATALVFLAGLTMLVSSAIPGAIEKLKYFRDIPLLPVISISHQIAVVVGFILLALSNGISYKDKRTFNATLFFLIFAAALFILMGVQYRQALFMLFIAMLLYLSKNRFYRISYIETWARSALNTVIISLIILGYIILGIMTLPNSKYQLPEKLKPLLIRDSGDLFKSALIGATVIAIVVMLEIWMRKKTQYQYHLAKDYQKDILAHINFYGAKDAFHFEKQSGLCVYWNNKHTVLIMFRKSADKLIVLGDLVGESKDFKETIEEFMQFADLYGSTPVFYEVSNRFIPNLYGYGYNFFKLGEEGYIHLPFAKEETLQHKLAKKKYHFDMLKPPFSRDFSNELASLSKSWRGEKEFRSEDFFFDLNYLNNGPIATLKDAENQIVAFAKLMPLHDKKNTLVLALLRSDKADVAKDDVEYLLTHIIAAAEQEKYERINLGMMYLKHVGVSKYAGVSEKIAAQIVVDGNEVKANEDNELLRERYATNWEQKYLAYRKRSFLPITMIQTMMLMGENRLSNKRNQIIAMRNLKKKVKSN